VCVCHWAARDQRSAAGALSVLPAGGNRDRNLGITDVRAAKKERSQVQSDIVKFCPRGLAFIFLKT